MRVHQVLGTSTTLWSLICVWPLKFDRDREIYRVDRFKVSYNIVLAILVATFFASMGFLKFSTYPSSFVS